MEEGEAGSEPCASASRLPDIEVKEERVALYVVDGARVVYEQHRFCDGEQSGRCFVRMIVSRRSGWFFG